MILDTRRRVALGAGISALVIVAGAGGYWLGRTNGGGTETANSQRKVLYWYDPMIPAEHHDGPGLSSMGMKLIPKYAGEAPTSSAGVAIDPRAVQNLGARIVAARVGTLPTGITVTGVVDYNAREVAIMQARAGGFVERVYGLAPDDIVRAGTPIADVLVPEWGGAQQEYLALRRTGDAALARAARQRLVLLGMPSGQIAAAERSGRVHNVVTIRTPVGGVVKTLGVRQGMTLAPGQTLAEINGLGTVWVNAAIPEAQAGNVRVGVPAKVAVTAFPDETFTGRVTAILPQANL
jgi:Cu(I)/Ag(I) efflux system membrane fusion protein